MIELNEKQLGRVKELALNDDHGVLILAAASAAGLQGMSLAEAVTTVSAAIGTAEDIRRRQAGEVADESEIDGIDEDVLVRAKRGVKASKHLAAEWSSATLGLAAVRAAVSEGTTRSGLVRALLEAVDAIPQGVFRGE